MAKDGRREQVLRLYKELRSIDNEPDDDLNVDHEACMRKVTAAGQPLLSSQPRRGALYEYVYMFHSLPILDGLAREQIKAAMSKDGFTTARAIEMWREAECLALSPHSMDRLKQLPELQQIIAHTSIDAIHASAHSMAHLFARNAEHQQQQQRQPESRWDSDDSDVFYDCDDNPYREQQLKNDASLLQHLAPGLRLCLAAEVAVGMLCPSQPPPPDTPEHAAALQMFVAEADHHVMKEIGGHPDHPSGPTHNANAAVALLWSGMHTTHSGQKAFKSSDVWHRMIAPFFDLQLQLPPQQLLQLLLTLRQQQQQQDCDGVNKTAAAPAVAGGSNMPFEAALLHPEYQQQLQQLLHSWATVQMPFGMSEGCCTSSNLSSGSAADSVMACVQESMLLCQQIAAKQGSQTSSTESEQATALQQCDSLTQCFQQLHSTAQMLVVKFLQDQWSSCGSSSGPAWQQAVPLQVLLLAAQLQQLKGALQHMSYVLLDQAKQEAQQQQQQRCEQEGQRQVFCPPEQLQEQLSLLFKQVLCIVQCIRQFTASNDALNATAGSGTAAASNGVPVGQTTSSCIDSTDRGDSGSNSEACMDPATFFSAAGPLASGLWGFAQPDGAGVMEPVTAGPEELRVPDLQNKQQQQSESAQVLTGSQAWPDCPVQVQANCQAQPNHEAPLLTGHQAQPDRQAELLQRQVWQVLLGSIAWQLAVAQADTAVAQHLHDICVAERSVLDRMVARLYKYKAPWDSKHKTTLAAWSQEFRDLGLEGMYPYLLDIHAVPAAVSESIQRVRCMAFIGVGFDVTAWHKKTLRQQERRVKQAQLIEQLHKLQSSGLGFKSGALTQFSPEELRSARQQGLLDIEDDPYAILNSESDSDEEDTDAEQADQQWLLQQALHSAGQDDRVCLSSTGAGHGSSSRSSSRAGSSTAIIAAAPLQLAAEVKAAHQALRQLTRHMSEQFEPFRNWHNNWIKQFEQQNKAAVAWWESAKRRKQAENGSRGRMPEPTSGPAISSNSTYSNTSSGKGSSGNGREQHWPHGEYDYNAECPLCAKELQQSQQQNVSGSRGSSTVSSNIYSQPPVPYSDPFMWRRLLWQLLGKLSPQAQAFYAQYLAACPHCSSWMIWVSIRRSIFHTLWSSPNADAVEQQLSCSTEMSVHDNAKRGKRLRLYARALNASYCEGYTASVPLLAQQLLLALSPLHQQLLPRPETAFLCPSSFSAAIGKALQQQLFSQQGLLDMFQHHSTQLHMWHVWWHLGIRRYAAMQQQEEAKQQRNVLSAQDFDQLYSNPDARVYAVAYATGQVSGALNTASSSASDRRLSSAADAAQAAQDASLRFADELRRLALKKAAERNLAADVVHYGQVDAHSPQAHVPRDVVKLISRVCRQLSKDDAAQLLPALLFPDREPLTGAEVRQRLQIFSVRNSLSAVVEYLQHSQRDLGEAARVFLQSQEDDPLQYCSSSCDTEQLAQLPPIPIEALVPPELWVAWEQQLVEQRTIGQSTFVCDACDVVTEKHDPKVTTCPECHVAAYCSERCRAMAAASHALVCRQVAKGRRRYSQCTHRCQSATCSHDKIMACQRLHFLLQQPTSKPEPWTLGLDTGAVDRDPSVLPHDLFIQEFARLFGQAVADTKQYRTAESGARDPWSNYRA